MHTLLFTVQHNGGLDPGNMQTRHVHGSHTQTAWDPHLEFFQARNMIMSTYWIIDLHSYSIHLVTYIAYYYYNDVKGTVSSHLQPFHINYLENTYVCISWIWWLILCLERVCMHVIKVCINCMGISQRLTCYFPIVVM